MTTYHTVTTVCREIGVKPHVLRYWEKEFDIKVKRNSAGRRIYSDGQVEKLRLIKHLVRVEKMTVKGALRKLTHMRREPQQKIDFQDYRQPLFWIKKELIAIRGKLGEPKSRKPPKDA